MDELIIAMDELNKSLERLSETLTRLNKALFDLNIGLEIVAQQSRGASKLVAQQILEVENEQLGA